MSKPKIYEYEGRTFEVEIYRENFGLAAIFVNEVIRPNRKFFGRTRSFYYDYVPICKYPTVDKAIEAVIDEGMTKEGHNKFIESRWKKWIES